MNDLLNLELGTRSIKTNAALKITSNASRLEMFMNHTRAAFGVFLEFERLLPLKSVYYYFPRYTLDYADWFVLKDLSNRAVKTEFGVLLKRDPDSSPSLEERQRLRCYQALGKKLGLATFDNPEPDWTSEEYPYTGWYCGSGVVMQPSQSIKIEVRLY